jgi:very-short-patch-repair endonuclease
MNSKLRPLRRPQTREERQLWQALRGRHFAGFKWRRQHPHGGYRLDFYCPEARLAVELDGFHHGLAEQTRHDEARAALLAQEGIEVLRFWNHQWRGNQEGCLLEIWNAVQGRTGCVSGSWNPEGRRFVPPSLQEVKIPATKA